MTYLFSNVIRPSDPSEYAEAVRDMVPIAHGSDTLVFFNVCAPLLICRDVFQACRIMLVRRIDTLDMNVVQGGDEWEKALSVPCDNREAYNIDDSGNIYDLDLRKLDKVDVDEGYPGIYPTSGYMIYRWIIARHNDQVSLVNFYGAADNSTPMWEGHDYAYENMAMRKESRLILLGDHR